jgi:hypothetical protein
MRRMVRLPPTGGIGVSHEAARAYHGPMNSIPRSLALAAALAAASSASAESPWPVAGQQGLVRYVIVPSGQARDAEGYLRQVAQLCDPERTCFLNFYTNSSGAPVSVPLPDAIAAEATATFRRSMKNGAERLMWSCRMKMPQQECF